LGHLHAAPESNWGLGYALTEEIRFRNGRGEPEATTMGPVFANAIYDAIGVPLFTLPMTPARILEACRA
jgi:hypothetical protein